MNNATKERKIGYDPKTYSKKLLKEIMLQIDD